MMPIEIERKFLVTNSDWKSITNKETLIKQGYITSNLKRTVRVRVKEEKGFLTIKGKTVNTSRAEYEYEIPLSEALELMNLCEGPLIEKTRYEVIQNGDLWEVDVFEGANKGLIVAELELESEDQEVTLPDWVGKEVSHEEKYFNSKLINNPYRGW